MTASKIGRYYLGRSANGWGVFDFEGVGAVSSFKKKLKAENSTDPSELSKLAKSNEFTLRLRVIENRHVTPDILRALAIKETGLKEPSWTVLDAIARHPSTPMDALIYMIKNPSEYPYPYVPPPPP